MANEAHVVTGYQGTPHVSSADAGLFNAGVVGLERYVLGTGEILRRVVQSNSVMIYPGDLVDQGRHINLPEIATVHIENAPSGYQRRDHIAIRYDRDYDGVETATVTVIQGTPAQDDPDYPTVSRGDIFGGDNFDYFLLYDVLADETGIVSCTANDFDFIVISPLAELQTYIGTGTATGTAGASPSVASADYKTCRLVKTGKHVTCYVGIGYNNGTSTLGSGTGNVYFTVPNGWMPSVNAVYPAMAHMSSGIVRMCNLTCNPLGEIYTASSGMGNATSIYGTLEWDVE